MSWRRVLISTPAVRVRRDRSGRLLDTGKAIGAGGKDNSIYGADDDSEYNNLGYLDYLELLDYIDNAADIEASIEAKPPTLETLYLNDNNDNNDVAPNPVEFQQAGLYNEALVEIDLELAAILI